MTYTHDNRTFEIIKHQGYWCAIEDKYIDPETGRLTQELNGLQMMASETAGECIRRCRERVVYEKLMSWGCTQGEALGYLYNWTPEQIKAFDAINANP